ncbi:uncharacterized protein YecT (DUF1311 family) [Pseudomonas sp. 478]|nr:uncharacterized protein YecT (DUF1311 family) [Pseudomonas sp. 478]TCV52163.1 uncharacterized protein YecT (DUF1311 family) [Pseudomonas sp. 460]
MKVIGLFAVLLLGLLPVSNAFAEDCQEVNIDGCAEIAMKAADSRLNTRYHELMARLETQYQGDLELGAAYAAKVKESQRAWIKLRDANCAVEAFEIETSKLAHVTVVSNCIARMSQERSDYLSKIAPGVSREAAPKDNKTSDVACPSTDFSTFLTSFSESSAIQKAFVHRPLQLVVTVDAEPEPKQQKRGLSDEQIKFPIMPDRVKREAGGLTLIVKETQTEHAIAILQKPDTDYAIEYRFVLGKCWMLSEVSDFSL